MLVPDNLDEVAQLVERVLERGEGSLWYTPSVSQTVSSRVRQQLMDYHLLAPAVIHGDVHSGNLIVIRDAEENPEILLLDWARARRGSPLEDIRSWLQSLGYWEPEARRRHDTLFRRYLEARGLSTCLTRDLRDAYWLAAASNSLAGALVFHVKELLEATTPLRRDRAYRHVRDHLRIIRRADACINGARVSGNCLPGTSRGSVIVSR